MGTGSTFSLFCVGFVLVFLGCALCRLNTPYTATIAPNYSRSFVLLIVGACNFHFFFTLTFTFFLSFVFLLFIYWVVYLIEPMLKLVFTTGPHPGYM